MDFKHLRDKYFANNLLKANYRTKITGNTYQIFLKNLQTFNCISIRENIKYGQRIKRFSVEAKENNTWKTLASATTIGSERILYFENTKTKEIRIIVEETSARLHFGCITN